MFKKAQKILSLGLLMTLSISIYGMERENFFVAVRNNYGAQIDISYTIQGKHYTVVLNPDDTHILGESNKLSDDIKIYRSGAVMGFLAVGYAMQVNGLAQLWVQKRAQNANTLLLMVKSEIGKLVVEYLPTNKATLETKKKVEMFSGDLLDQFPGLKKYGLEKTLTPARILAIRSWKEEVVPGGWVVRATTGEDIARYLLGLPKQYNLDSVKKAYATLSLRWHPDKQTVPYLKDLSQQVMPLITHARDLLQEALRDKGPQ